MRSSKTKFAKMISFLVLACVAIMFFHGCKLLAGQDLDILNCDNASFNSFISYIISSTRYQEAIDNIFTDEPVGKLKRKVTTRERSREPSNEYNGFTYMAESVSKELNNLAKADENTE